MMKRCRNLRWIRPAVPVLLTILVLTIGMATAASASTGQLRDMVAEADLTALDGTPAEVIFPEGEVTVIHFWASWCPPCKKELPLLDDVAKSLQDRPVQFIAISIDSSRKKAQRFVQRAGLDLPFYHDKPGGLAEQLSIPFLPCTYVIDSSGQTVFATTGAGEDQIDRLRAKLLSLTAPGHAAGPTP